MALTKVKGSGLATGAATASLVGIDDNATSTAITIDASENVGIGVLAPTAPLDIQSNPSAAAVNIVGRTGDDISEIDFYENDKVTKLGELQYRQDHLNLRHRVGDIRFATGGTTERMRILSSGGITFNGDTAAANALDDYEEGTWTPTVTSGTSSLTYNLQVGTYTKIGSLVSIQGVLSFSAFTGDANFLTISLPFASLGISGLWVQGTLLVDHLTVDKKQVNVQNSPGGNSVIAICNGGSTTGHSGIPGNQFSVSSAIRFSISFRT